MEKFVNEYEYNIDVIKENKNKWWNIKFKKSSVKILMILIVCLLLYIFSKKNVFLISTFLLIIPIIFFIIKKSIAVKFELKTIEEKYNSDSFKIRIEIDKQITLITSRCNKKFDLNIIESFYETKNLIVLNVQNSTTIALKKDSFVEGTL